MNDKQWLAIIPGICSILGLDAETTTPEAVLFEVARLAKEARGRVLADRKWDGDAVTVLRVFDDGTCYIRRATDGRHAIVPVEELTR